MTILRVGSNAKYADGWDLAFGKKKGGAKAKKTASAAEPKAKATKKKKAKK